MPYLVTEYDYNEHTMLVTIRRVLHAPMYEGFKTFDKDGLKAYISGRFSEEYAAYVMEELHMGNNVKIPLFRR